MLHKLLSINGKLLFESEAETMWKTVEEAVKKGINLFGADLRGADLRGAYLGEAYLGGADLGGANLGEAYLRGANLGEANLVGANLRGANLRGADLRGANLRGANLCGANLGEAKIKNTQWPSPTMVLLAYWGVLTKYLTLSLMRYDASNHPIPKRFIDWAATNECPYKGMYIERSANFEERDDLITIDFLSLPVKSAYELMILLFKECCILEEDTNHTEEANNHA